MDVLQQVRRRVDVEQLVQQLLQVVEAASYVRLALQLIIEASETLQDFGYGVAEHLLALFYLGEV